MQICDRCGKEPGVGELWNWITISARHYYQDSLVKAWTVCWDCWKEFYG